MPTMAMMASLGRAWVAIAVLSVVGAQNLQEGSSCYNHAANSPGVCRRMVHCRWATEEVANERPGRGYPQICSFRGNEPLVCCPTSPESIVFPSLGFLSGSSPPQGPSSPPPSPPPPATETGGSPPEPAQPSAPQPNAPPPADGTPGSMARRMCVEYEKLVPPIRYGTERDCVFNHTYPIGGNPALPKEFPHMTLLGNGDEKNINYYCGGSLVSLLWVLTAAHCVFDGAEPVRWALVGELVRSVTTDDANPQRIPVAERISHPGFKPPVAYNDIALLRLQWKPDMSTFHVRPTCLNVDRELKQEKLYLTGWGHTEEKGEQADALMEVALYRTKYEECVKTYDASAEYYLPRGVDDETQICAGAGELLRDACQGDSGGPLQTPVNKATCFHKLTGIVSLGQGCGRGAAGLYTRVSYYVPWIESIVWPDP